VKTNEDNLLLSATKMFAVDSGSTDVRILQIFAKVLVNGAVEDGDFLMPSVAVS